MSSSRVFSLPVRCMTPWSPRAGLFRRTEAVDLLLVCRRHLPLVLIAHLARQLAEGAVVSSNARVYKREEHVPSA